MEKFLLNTFFDLEQFAHSEAFEGCTYAWDALGKLEGYLEKADLGQINCPIPEGAYLIHPELIAIGEGTVIEPGAFIRGPCIIGRGCEVRHGAYIRGDVLIGDDCVIGHDCELKHSILLNEVSVAHFNYVGDSILGNRVNLGAGAKLANMRLDHQCVAIEGISTNLKKLGAIVGDGSQFGCNSVANPGTVIGKGAFCHPCAVIRGYIPPKAMVKSTSKMVIQEYVDRSCF